MHTYLAEIDQLSCCVHFIMSSTPFEARQDKCLCCKNWVHFVIPNAYRKKLILLNYVSFVTTYCWCLFFSIAIYTCLTHRSFQYNNKCKCSVSITYFSFYYKVSRFLCSYWNFLQNLWIISYRTFIVNISSLTFKFIEWSFKCMNFLN